jgi:hypothetical protein
MSLSVASPAVIARATASSMNFLFLLQTPSPPIPA